MKKVCSFCKADMGEVSPFDNDAITSGICASCYEEQSHKWLRFNYSQYLKNLSDPAFVANKDVRIYAVNSKFQQFLAHDPKVDLRGLLCGEVLCCQHSEESCHVGLRCGGYDSCRDCTIRSTIESVVVSRESREKVHAWIMRDNIKHEILISAYWKKENTVLVVINDKMS